MGAVRPDRPRDEEPDQATARRIAGVRIERVPGYHDHHGALPAPASPRLTEELTQPPPHEAAPREGPPTR
jgi:hypothetical protein